MAGNIPIIKRRVFALPVKVSRPDRKAAFVNVVLTFVTRLIGRPVREHVLIIISNAIAPKAYVIVATIQP
jgi:hypothetical protein